MNPVRHLWSALCPDLRRRNWETDTTFRMLVAAMAVFAVVLATWAIGAGVMRTVWLYDWVQSDRWIGLGGSKHKTGFGELIWVALFAVVQIARGMAGLLALCMVGGLVGAALGFLFGLPRPLAVSEQDRARAADPNRRWKLSTNLTEVSDWLTKIIIGVGLVEAQHVWTALASATGSAAASLFNSRHGSPAVILSAEIGGAIFGFLFAYLYTQLIVARLFVEADVGLATSAGATQHIRAMPSSFQGIAPRISRSRSPTALVTTQQPSLEQVAAAVQLNIPFAELISRPDLTREEVWNWGRAKAILNDYTEAAKAYIHLLGMPQP